ncbi:MAG TPA: urea ABC transporter ATP-binding subunit UrtE [Polyangiaceae bacterium]|nr:urea ABC transporter ATP-binding subunit UrtE [Polyangiaceae bacterium]
MLTVSALNQSYGESRTLWDVDLELRAGKCRCLMGRNGVGKTTLLKSIMGLLKIEGGRIKLGKDDLTTVRPEVRASSGIGYVPQGREIFPQLTVRENLEIGLLGRKDKSSSPIDKIFGLFPVLKEMLHRRGGDLSGGQQQQLAIGRALALTPQLLILDEPTEGIQPNVVSQIGDVLIQLREEGMTILLVEQKLKFARRVADDFTILDRGRAVAHGAMDELSEDLVKQYLVV